MTRAEIEDTIEIEEDLEVTETEDATKLKTKKILKSQKQDVLTVMVVSGQQEGGGERNSLLFC